MTINLFDIPVATSAYIDNEVDVRIARVTGNLERGEEGTYTVRVTNAAAPNGVRLTDLVLHVTVAPSSVATLIPPGSALLFPRAENDDNDPRLSTSDRVAQMFIFFNTDDLSTLEVGEVLEQELEYEAGDPGNATISCHVHASVVVDDLFPRSGGSNGSKTLTVLA